MFHGQFFPGQSIQFEGDGNYYGAPVALSHLGSAVDSANLSSYTFASKSMGAEASDRYILVHEAHAQAGGLERVATGISVAGVAGSNLVDNQFPDASFPGGSSWWICAVPTGTTGDIVVTFGAATGLCGVSWYRLVSLASPLAVATAIDEQSGDVSSTIDVRWGGVVVAGMYHFVPTVGYSHATGSASSLRGQRARSIGASGNVSWVGVSGDVTALVQGNASASTRKCLTAVSLR